VTYDRPGYGESDRQRNRTVRDAADDVRAIADHLEVERFAVVGRSGGGPHALACAAELGQRVTKAAVLVSIAPSDAEDLNWYDGMNNANTREYKTVDRVSADHRGDAESGKMNLPTHPDMLLASLKSQLTESDRRVVDDVAMRRLLLSTYEEGLAQGQDGWIDDVLAFRRPWHIDLAKIVSPVRIWHGADDSFSPTDHSRWLARQIPGAELMIQPKYGHFGAVEVLTHILPWLSEAVETANR
jgi:pimeloyl-ACP methyl ester carboxylesterase